MRKLDIMPKCLSTSTLSNEHARRIAIGAAIRSHHTLDAERHYLEIVQLLQNELDVTPERETIDLYQKGLRSDR